MPLRSSHRRLLRHLAAGLLAAGSAVSTSLHAADGDPVAHGLASFDLAAPFTDLGQAVATLPDGRVLVAGSVPVAGGGYTIVLARFLPNGALDPTFGSGGRLINPLQRSESTSAVALKRLRDGRILLAGNLDYGGGDVDFCVARLFENGALDPAFGLSGTGLGFVSFDLGGDWSDVLGAMALDRSGRILLVGTVDSTSSDSWIGAARLTAEGHPDGLFDFDGKTTVSIGEPTGADLGLSVVSDGGGRILIGGATAHAAPVLEFDVALVRLTPGGAPDGSFAQGGVFVVGSSSGGSNNEFLWAVGVWPDGEIVAAGDFATGDDTWYAALFRLSSNGTFLDLELRRFCVGLPVCPQEPQDSVRAMALQSDGKIVLAGFGRSEDGDRDFGVMRLGRNLSLDGSFAHQGAGTFDFGVGGGQADAGNSVVFDPSGRIVVAGTVGFNGLDTDIGWVRFDNSYIFADGFDWPEAIGRWSEVLD